jgi:group I intron endonuclease
MYICCALLKHDYSNFKLEILEYCEVSELLIREKYYIDLLGSEYNTVKDPTLPPMSNRTHSDETRKIISEAKIGSKHTDKSKTIMSEAKKADKNPMFGQTIREETKKKISDALTGKNHPKGAGRPSQAIEVFDLQEKTMTYYYSMSEAARTLNIFLSVINMYFINNQQKPYKNRFIFKKI